MTQAELAELLSIAGADTPNRREDEKRWAETQMTNEPKIVNRLPEPSIDDFQLSEPVDQPIIDVANRLNGLLGNHFLKDVKIERL